MKWLRRELGFLGSPGLRESGDAPLGARNPQTSGACGLFLNGSLAVSLLRFGDKGGEGDPAVLAALQPARPEEAAAPLCAAAKANRNGA